MSHSGVARLNRIQQVGRAQPGPTNNGPIYYTGSVS